MRHIDTDYIRINILDARTVLVEAKEGVEIDAEKSRHANELIGKEMPGNYGMIIDRKCDYSIVPIDVYRMLNSLSRLKAIAIVIHKSRTFLPISTEQKLFKGELEVFQSIQEAQAWIAKIVTE